MNCASSVISQTRLGELALATKLKLAQCPSFLFFLDEKQKSGPTYSTRLLFGRGPAVELGLDCAPSLRPTDRGMSATIEA